MAINPENDYIHLASDGTVKIVPGGEAFWSLPEVEIEKFGHGWLISEFVSTVDWPSWEMHPIAEEFIYLLEGEVNFLLELPTGTTTTHLVGKGAVIVPRGVWHTAKVLRPSRMLIITMGSGTQHKSV
jgi:mannose-6-phosphate isomerase-like protein (cupin superfamily)